MHTHRPQLLYTKIHIGSNDNGQIADTISMKTTQTKLHTRVVVAAESFQQNITINFMFWLSRHCSQSSTTQPRSPRKEIAYERQLWLGPATHGGVRRIEARGGKSEGKATHGYGNSFERARSRDAKGRDDRCQNPNSDTKRCQPTRFIRGV